MKTATTHVSNFVGIFAPEWCADDEGVIKYHDHKKYADMESEDLQDLEDHRMSLVRSAASVELANRDQAQYERKEILRRASW